MTEAEYQRGIREAEARDAAWKAAGNPTPENPPTWAIVHLMGHVRYAGRLSEEEKFGSKLGRVDVPDGEGFRTVYFGGSSVYKVEIVSEAAARVAARVSTPLPVSPWDFPKQLPAVTGDVMDDGQTGHGITAQQRDDDLDAYRRDEDDVYDADDDSA